MTHSQNINEIATALAKAQGEMKNPQNENVNAFQKYNYAKADDFLNIIREPLARNGLTHNISIESTPGDLDDLMVLFIGHASGQWMRYEIPFRKIKGGDKGSIDQAFAGQFTYRKKSILQGVFGIHGTEDDDDAAMAKKEQDRKHEASKNTNEKGSPQHVSTDYDKVTPEQVKQMMYELGSRSDLVQVILSKYQVNSLSDLPREDYLKILEAIRTRVKTGK